MDYLYSLYDALVSINVPSDKARAVVDAMERDMGTTLATKKDLEAQSFATRKDLESQTLATRKDLELLRMATKQDLEVLRMETKQDLEILKREMENRFALVDKRFDVLESKLKLTTEALELRMTVKLGTMLFLGLGLTIAVLRLWS